jgi:hypothetical protein
MNGEMVDNRTSNITKLVWHFPLLCVTDEDGICVGEKIQLSRIIAHPLAKNWAFLLNIR